jgi:RND superfamily putative drug exporter
MGARRATSWSLRAATAIFPPRLESALLNLARWSTTHRKYVVLGWIVLLFAVNALAQSAGTSYSNNFTLPHSGAQSAADLLQRSFPTQAGDRDTIVFKVATGSIHEAAVRARMSAAFQRIRTLKHVSAVVSPYEGAASGRSVSTDGRIAFATVVFDEKANLLPKSAPEAVVKAAKEAVQPGLQVELGGQAIEMTEQPGFGISTAVGLMAAIVVLLLTFGSLIAMGLPIVTALFGLGTGLGAIALFTHVVDTPDFASELAAMIGLGVGIDYALFILTRFREAYRTPGPSFGDARESVLRAIDTAGRAVLFAGTTVVIALLGMMLLGVSFLYGVAISASIGVLLVMFASLTLLPALLTMAGHKVARPSRRARRRAAREENLAPQATNGAGNGSVEGDAVGSGAWLRWSRFVGARPGTIALLSALVMLAIAAPALALRLGSSDASNDPADKTTHKAYELLAEGFGEGFNGPLLVVAQTPQAGSPSVGSLASAIERTPGVASVVPPKLSPSRTVAAISVYPRSSPQAYATTQLVERLRDSVAPGLERGTGMKVYVGGVTAGAVDFATTLGHKLPLFIGVVVLLSALLLLIVFRSLVIPLQAAVMNLLSIGAALGVIVAVFQWGWLGSLFGVQKGPIESFIPVMLFAIVFGLSMDYEVFLVSRIHERWTQTRDSTRAVGDGLALTGRVVTAAAAIMVCVFLSFMLGEDRVIKEFGLSLASAVLLDALVVRCLLLPATLHLLGGVTWQLPAWLDRLLPRVNIEGTMHTPPSQPGVVAEPVAAGAVASDGAEA